MFSSVLKAMLATMDKERVNDEFSGKTIMSRSV